MKKLSCWFYSLIVVGIYCFLYPKIKSFVLYVFSRVLLEYTISFIDVNSSIQTFMYALSTDIVLTLIAGILTGFIASMFLLSRIDISWKTYAACSLIIYLMFAYLMLTVQFEEYFVDQEIGIQVIRAINPIIAGSALLFSQWMLSRFRRRLPSTT